MQADPLYLSAETSLYAYVEGDPVLWYDRAGLHRDGGPWHPDRPVACTAADDCPTLKAKIGLISRTIASHKKWDAMDLALGGSGGRHADEIADWINAINTFRSIYEKKCRNDYDSCRPCKFVKEGGPAMVFGYIIYKTVEFFVCPPLVPVTP
jgi:hypothetical protein